MYYQDFDVSYNIITFVMPIFIDKFYGILNIYAFYHKNSLFTSILEGLDS